MKKHKDEATSADDKKRHERELEGGTAGALAGATIGAIAGAPGIVAGAVVGAITGAVAGRAVQKDDAERAAEDRELDHEIGVSSAELGAPNLEHPPAKIGAYSGSSTGAGATEEEEPAEGPFQSPTES